MKRFFLRLNVLVVLLTIQIPAMGDALDFLKSAVTKSNSTSVAGLALPQEQVASGLKEALGKGVERAVASLGKTNGFLNNLNVKIQMPAKLQYVEKGLRAVKQDKLADDFVASMNHAAEQAVPVAAPIFGDAIKQMSIADAKAILSGPDDSATQFFKKTTTTNLHAKFYPLVQKATSSVGVTASYKKMMSGFTSSDSLGGLLGKTASKFEAADIDNYVTSRAMDGLFKVVADEEKAIRANPAARTTELLQKVFGTAK